MSGTANVAILLFDDVQALDFCGPMDVFSVTKIPDQPAPFNVFTCAEKTDPVWAHNHLSINPQYPLHNCPAPDVLVVPGGWGTREQLTNTVLLDWLKKTVPRAQVTLSVCTGSLLLAKAGLLDGLSITTHHEALDLLRLMAPQSTVRRFERYIDNGKIVVAAGITAGIDASLHIVGKLVGPEIARATADYLEYTCKAAAISPA